MKIDETGKHYVKQNKPNSETQVQFFSHMENPNLTLQGLGDSSVVKVPAIQA